MKTTKEAAHILGVSISSLQQAVWLERIPAPEKFGSNYIWTEADIEKAATAFQKKKKQK